ncbi:MAG: hypothetical protein KBS74_08055 [Clostridiales bacterium]|nr:hypothetical protein [Candidatus Cacconaster stercorequi]
MKKFVGIVALAIVLLFGLYGVNYMYNNIPITYDGSDTDVVELYNNPKDYDTSDPDGVADLIVKTGLDRTMAVNNVAAIVFDYRGYDTIGESFILLAAISGSFIILRVNPDKKEEDIDE